MWWNGTRIAISVLVIVAVTELSQRYPRLGAVLLTLPIISILAFVMAWTRHHDLTAVSRLARETLVLVPLGLPFFLPLAFAQRLGLGFWQAFTVGTILATALIIGWLWLAPPSI